MMTVKSGFFHTLFYLTVAFFTSFLPEKVKRHPWLREFDSTPLHIFSGILEAALSLFLFARGFISFIAAYDDPDSGRYLAAARMIRHGEVFGLGVMTWTAYVLQPISWLYIFCLVEGVIRSLDAALNERNLGVAFLNLPFRVGERVRRVYGDRKKRAVFGPPRPDEVCLTKDARSLEIYSFEEKPWFDRQVVRYQDELWVLQWKDLTLRGKYHWHHYRFRRLGPGEIVRGQIAEVVSPV